MSNTVSAAAPWARTLSIALALVALMAVPQTVAARSPLLPGEEWAGDQPAGCSLIGLSTFVAWPDSAALRDTWIDQSFAEIPHDVVASAFSEAIRRAGIFPTLVSDADDPHGLDLVFRIVRLQRRPFSSANDMWVEATVDLTDRRDGRTLWTRRLGLPVEERDVAPRLDSPEPGLYYLLARAAGIRLAEQSVRDLSGFVADRCPRGIVDGPGSMRDRARVRGPIR